jgi:hypothetical protein
MSKAMSITASAASVGWFVLTVNVRFPAASFAAVTVVTSGAVAESPVGSV